MPDFVGSDVGLELGCGAKCYKVNPEGGPPSQLDALREPARSDRASSWGSSWLRWALEFCVELYKSGRQLDGSRLLDLIEPLDPIEPARWGRYSILLFSPLPS